MIHTLCTVCNQKNHVSLTVSETLSCVTLSPDTIHLDPTPDWGAQDRGYLLQSLEFPD